MKLSGSHTFEAEPEQIRSLLLAPRSLRWVIPGCQWLSGDGSGPYQLAVRQRVGQTNGLYEGELTLGCHDNSDGLRAVFDLGGSLGRATGEIAAAFRAAGPGTTVLTFDGTVEFAGGLTIHPPRLLQTVTRAFIREMMAALEQQVARANGVRFVSAAVDLPVSERSAAAGRRRTASILLGLLAGFIALAWLTQPRADKSSEQVPHG